VIGSVLVPFLAIYASYGFLSEDVFRFVNTAVADELFDVDALLGTGTIDVNRTALATGWVAMLVVVVALAARFGLGALGRRRRIRGLVWAAAYVEALWLVTLARTLSAHKDAASDWLGARAAVRMIADAWRHLVTAAGQLADAIDRVTLWTFGLLGSVDALIVVPVAWLTVGAIVYGRELSESPRRAAAHRASTGQPLVSRVPQPVRAVGRTLTAGLVERFGEIGKGLRRLAPAGLAPMLLFAVAFVAAQRLEYALNLAWRELLGPMPLGTMLAFSPHTAMVSHAVGTTVVVCLLGAAIDRVLSQGSASRHRSRLHPENEITWRPPGKPHLDHVDVRGHDDDR
jgi:hypothetical protein